MFHDLRGAAGTPLSEAGCTPKRYCHHHGQSLRDVAAIPDRYLGRTE
jgi:hypothetical protein